MKDTHTQIRNLTSIFPWVRARAANDLVEIGLPAVKEIIANLDTPYVPICINTVSSSNRAEFSALANAVERYPNLVDALVKIGKPAIAELTDALRHPNLNVRLSAMATLGRIGDRSVVDLMFPYLDSTIPEERAWAVSALENTRSPLVFERIIAALDDKNLEVRESAIRALGNFGNATALPKLEQIAETDKTLVESYGLTLGHRAKEAIEKIRKTGERQDFGSKNKHRSQY